MEYRHGKVRCAGRYPTVVDRKGVLVQGDIATWEERVDSLCMKEAFSLLIIKAKAETRAGLHKMTDSY